MVLFWVDETTLAVMGVSGRRAWHVRACRKGKGWIELGTDSDEAPREEYRAAIPNHDRSVTVRDGAVARHPM